MNNLNCSTRAALALLLALPVSVQLVGGQSGPVQPYTAEFKTIHLQTLADGTTITRETKEVMARDSQGRVMRATTQIPAAPDQPATTSVHVDDAIDRLQGNWNSRTKQARVIRMPADRPRGTCWSTASSDFTLTIGPVAPLLLPPPASAPTSAATPAQGAGVTGSSGVSGAVFSGPVAAPNVARIRPVREELGTDTIMGVEVRGYRTTVTTPVGRIGNDQPLVSTTETWTAASLGITVRQISEDPRMGKTTREMVNLDLSEPEPSVFQPPAGYEVLNEEMHEVPCQQAR
jgi:hypothetical protein